MIRVRFFVEYLGNSEEFLSKRIKENVDKIKERYSVVEYSIGEPERIEKNTYSSYLEITIDFESIEDLFAFILDFTPTVVEVLSPDKITLSISEFQNILNDFASKVRTVAWAARELWAQNQLLRQKILDIMKEVKEKTSQ